MPPNAALDQASSELQALTQFELENNPTLKAALNRGSPISVLTSPCLLQYANLVNPVSNPQFKDSDPMWSCLLIFPWLNERGEAVMGPVSRRMLAYILAVEWSLAATRCGGQSKFPVISAGGRTLAPARDGKPRTDIVPAGSFAIRAKRNPKTLEGRSPKGPPRLLDSTGEIELSADEFTAGSWVQAILWIGVPPNGVSVYSRLDSLRMVKPNLSGEVASFQRGATNFDSFECSIDADEEVLNLPSHALPAQLQGGRGQGPAIAYDPATGEQAEPPAMPALPPAAPPPISLVPPQAAPAPAPAQPDWRGVAAAAAPVAPVEPVAPVAPAPVPVAAPAPVAAPVAAPVPVVAPQVAPVAHPPAPVAPLASPTATPTAPAAVRPIGFPRNPQAPTA